MNLKEHITEEIKAAMKAKAKIRLETLRSIKKVLLEKEVSVRPAGQTELTTAQEIEALTQVAKQRRDAIEQYQKADRLDLAALEAEELAIIETFLPQQLSDAEIAQAIATLIAEVGATSPQDMGKVMGPIMQQLQGQADGRKVQAMVKAQLGGEV